MLASFVAVLIASFTLMRLFAGLRPATAQVAGVTEAAVLLPWELAQQFVLAGVAVGGVVLAAPAALRLRGQRDARGRRACGECVPRDGGWVRAAGLPSRFLVVGVLMVGMIGGVLSSGLDGGFSGEGVAFELVFRLDAIGTQADMVLRGLPGSLAACAGFALLCLLTGVYEEAFLRVLGRSLFKGAFRDKGLSGHGALLAAALATSVLFALLHAGAPAADAGAAGWLQVVLRFVQTFSFGMCMAALLARTRRLAPCALAHAGFNLLYLGPNFTLDPTYGSGAPSETVLLAVTAVLLAGMAVLAWRRSAR